MAKRLSQALEDIRKQMAGTYSVRIGLNDQESVDKLGWLKDANRDFLAVTPQLVKSATAGLVESLKSADLSNPRKAVDDAVHATGEAVLEHIAKRFQGGKRDVKMRPLSRGWVRKKGHNRIGVFSGDLFRDLLNASVVIRRVK